MRAAEADMLHDSPINLLTEVLANNCLFTHEATSAAGCLSPYSKCPISISFLPWLSLTYVPVHAAGAAQRLVFLFVRFGVSGFWITRTRQSLKVWQKSLKDVHGPTHTLPTVLFCHTWDKTDGFYTFILSSLAQFEWLTISRSSSDSITDCWTVQCSWVESFLKEQTKPAGG